MNGAVHVEGSKGCCSYVKPPTKREKLIAKVKARGAGIKVGGGVFSAPTCLACNAHMVKRKNRDGEDFWGCSKWPECDGHPEEDEDEAMLDAFDVFHG